MSQKSWYHLKVCQIQNLQLLQVLTCATDLYLLNPNLVPLKILVICYPGAFFGTFLSFCYPGAIYGSLNN